MNLDQFIGDGKTHRIPLIWDDAPYSPPEGSVLIWTAKRSDSDLDPAALVQKISGVNLTVSGTDALVTLVHADTVAMAAKIAAVWDIQCQAPGESPKTLNSGLIAFRRDITRALTTSIPIFTINPPAVAGGDYVSAAIAVETSSREAADESLAGDIASEVSARTSADQSLTTRVSIEESTRLAQDALKLDKSGGTVTGALAVTASFTAGSGTGKAFNGSWPSNTAIAGWCHTALSDTPNAFALYQTSTGATYLNYADGQTLLFRKNNINVGSFGSDGNFSTVGAATIGGTLTANGAATFNSTLTADTITNYAAEITITALLALTPAQSAKLRIKPVSNAYRLDGTIGRVLAQWDGDSTAGTWRISGSGVAVTEDRLTFARSIRAVMPGKRQVRNGVSIQQFECGSVAVLGSAGINNTTAAFPYSSQLWANEANARINARLQSMWNYPGSGMRYVSARIILPRLSTAGNPFASIVRLCQNQQGIGANECGAIYDPQDIYGFGFGASVGAYSKGPNNTTTSPGAFSPVIWADYLVEIALTGTSVRIYVNGVLVGDISTNMPSDSVCLIPQVCFHRGAAASEGIDSLMMEFTAIDIH